MTFEVSIIKCGSYDENTVRTAIEASLEPLGGLQSVVKKGDRVLIKLNLLAAREPDKAVTTHPSVAKAVVRMVQELGAIPLLGDSPGGSNTLSSFKTLIEKTGIKKVADETGCEIVNFDDLKVEVFPDHAKVFKKFTISKAVMDADVVIGLPKLKTHQLTFFTGAVKLLYGYIPGKQKTEYHLHTSNDTELFAELLLDLQEARPADLDIMDAVVGMEGDGPSNGTPRKIGLIMASKSPTALDFVACSVVRFEPMKVPTVKKAFDRHTGPQSIGDIMIHGEKLESVLVKDFKKPQTFQLSHVPPLLMRTAKRMFAIKPFIKASKCKKCGQCVEHCPPKAMSFKRGSVPTIDYNRCIRCFCCQELCPEGAVMVSKPLLRKIFK